MTGLIHIWVKILPEVVVFFSVMTTYKWHLMTMTFWILFYCMSSLSCVKKKRKKKNLSFTTVKKELPVLLDTLFSISLTDCGMKLILMARNRHTPQKTCLVTLTAKKILVGLYWNFLGRNEPPRGRRCDLIKKPLISYHLTAVLVFGGLSAVLVICLLLLSQIYEAYDDDEIGALDDHDITGCITDTGTLLDSLVDDFQQQQQQM